MLDSVIEAIMNFLTAVFGFPQIAVTVTSMLPIVEARVGLPLALRYGMGYIESWLYTFIGSSAVAPLLLLFLMPFIKWLSGTKLFKRAGEYVYNKFTSQSEELENEAQNRKGKNVNLKKFWGVVTFVAVPLPLTGVWGGCAVASALKLNFWLALLGVVLGNLISSLFLLLLCIFFFEYINIILTVLGLLALFAIISLIIKIILSARKKAVQPTKKED